MIMDMTTNLMGDTLEKARLDFASDGLAIIPNFLDQNTIAEIVNLGNFLAGWR
jgi:hypothetical protein